MPCDVCIGIGIHINCSVKGTRLGLLKPAISYHITSNIVLSPYRIKISSCCIRTHTHTYETHVPTSMHVRTALTFTYWHLHACVHANVQTCIHAYMHTCMYPSMLARGLCLIQCQRGHPGVVLPLIILIRQVIRKGCNSN